jgi:hypothetical protein
MACAGPSGRRQPSSGGGTEGETANGIDGQKREKEVYMDMSTHKCFAGLGLLSALGLAAPACTGSDAETYGTFEQANGDTGESAAAQVVGKYLGSEIPAANPTVGWGTYSVDRNWYGSGFAIGGQHYSKGMFAHAPSSLTFPLNAGYTKFSFCVGQDDGDGNCGDGSEVTVYGDGKQLWFSGLGNGPAECATDLDVTGVKTLRLEAVARSSITCDEVAWVNAFVQ